MLLTLCLHSVEMLIVDATTGEPLRKAEINADLQKVAEVENLSTRTERALEYGSVLTKSGSISALPAGRDCSFTFRFYTNGAEHCKVNSAAGRLGKM